MTAYLIRRLLYTVPIVFGVALVVFVLFNVAGGDPVLIMMGKHGNPQLMDELRRELGLDQPLWIQFISYLKQIVTFDFGRSYASKQQISAMILEGVGPSLLIAIPAFTITTVLAVLTALTVSYFRGALVDRIVLVASVFGMSFPSLGIILFGQYFLAYKWQLFPIAGYSSGFPDAISYVALPVIIWVLVSLGTDVRFFRTAILDEVGQDYIRTARAKGLSEYRVFLKHVLRNSLVPIITYVVIQIPFLILGSLLLESFFGIPGLGHIVIDAVNNSDFPVLKAMTTVLSILYIFGTVVTDILYKLADPRVSFK